MQQLTSVIRITYHCRFYNLNVIVTYPFVCHERRNWHKFFIAIFVPWISAYLQIAVLQSRINVREYMQLQKKNADAEHSDNDNVQPWTDLWHAFFFVHFAISTICKISRRIVQYCFNRSWNIVKFANLSATHSFNFGFNEYALRHAEIIENDTAAPTSDRMINKTIHWCKSLLPKMEIMTQIIQCAARYRTKIHRHSLTTLEIGSIINYKCWLHNLHSYHMWLSCYSSVPCACPGS